MIKRRPILVALGGTAGVWPLTAVAQPAPGRLPRVAYLGVSSPITADPRQIKQFKAALIENKLIEGRNVIVEYYWAEGSLIRLRELAQTIVTRDIDVIVTVGPQSVGNFLATGTSIPIVMAIVSDPVGAGLVKTLSRPSETVTGLSMSNADLESKRLEILKSATPATTTVMVLHDPSMDGQGIESVKRAANTLGVEVYFAGVEAPDEFTSTFAVAAGHGVNGLAVMASPFLNFQRKQLIDLAIRHRLPSICEADIFVHDGGLISYGPNFADMYRRSAGYVAKILKGAKAADLPVEQPTRFELVVNLRTARLLGLDLPPTFLARVDEVIE